MATAQQLREETAAISAAALSELSASLVGVPDESIRALLGDLLPGLVAEFQDAAALLAAEWYDDSRSDLDIPGTFTAFVPDFSDPGVEALLGWAEAEAQNILAEVALIEGGVQRRVANGSRETIIQNVARDPQAIGHQRYRRESPIGCAFCKMLAARATLYRSGSSASFGAHDHCKCVAVPAWGGAPIPVRPYTPSTKNITDADRARVRAWVASH